MQPPDNTAALERIAERLDEAMKIAQNYARNGGFHGRRFALIVTTSEAALLQARRGLEEVAAEAAR